MSEFGVFRGGGVEPAPPTDLAIEGFQKESGGIARAVRGDQGLGFSEVLQVG